MDRGLVVSLSPNEETTLRQIALGSVRTQRVRERDVERLSKLALITQRGTGVYLTAIGRQRIEGLAFKRSGTGDVESPR